jgi:hypothetical protein
MSEENYNTRKRPYTFKVLHLDRGSKYGGNITIYAYDRSEAIEQFKETRLTLHLIHEECDIYPLGKDCYEFTCEPA